MDKYRSLFNLDGKVALVAGGGGDIGKAISEGLASFGATVVVCGRTLDKAMPLMHAPMAFSRMPKCMLRP